MPLKIRDPQGVVFDCDLVVDVHALGQAHGVHQVLLGDGFPGLGQLVFRRIAPIQGTVHLAQDVDDGDGSNHPVHLQNVFLQLFDFLQKDRVLDAFFLTAVDDQFEAQGIAQVFHHELVRFAKGEALGEVTVRVGVDPGVFDNPDRCRGQDSEDADDHKFLPM